MSSSTVLGINFGQSFASIAVIGKEGHASCIANEEGERQIACAISYNGEETYIGNGAKPQLVKNGLNTIVGFRNLLGKSYDQTTHTSTFSAPIVDQDGTPAYTVDVLVPPPALPTPSNRSAAPSGAATPAPREPTAAKHTITVPEVTTLFLKTLFDSASDFLGTPPTSVVMSCPSFFDETQKEALKAAANAADIPVVQLLDETAAALVAYRVGLVEERKERGLLGSAEEGDAAEEEVRDKTVVVVDLGETSLNVTVVQSGEGEYVELARHRDDMLGGRAFDDLLCAHFAKEFTKKTKVPLTLPCKEDSSVADKRAEMKLRLAVEHTKRSLSASSGSATCAVESLKDGLDLSAAITRLRFDGLASSVYGRIGDAIKSALALASLNPVQVQEVLLVGSSTLLPGIANNLGYLFPPTVPITSALDPSQVIAVGCALQAYHLAELPDNLPASTVLQNSSCKTLSEAIGIVFPRDSGSQDIDHVVIPAGTRLPCRREFAFTVADGSSTIAVELWATTIEITQAIPASSNELPDADTCAGDEDEEDVLDNTDAIAEVQLGRGRLLSDMLVTPTGPGRVTLSISVKQDGSVTVIAA